MTTQTDTSFQLRQAAEYEKAGYPILMKNAAEEIDELRARRDELLAALEYLLASPQGTPQERWEAGRLARAAIAKEKG